jgi:hypothetical protein
VFVCITSADGDPEAALRGGENSMHVTLFFPSFADKNTVSEIKIRHGWYDAFIALQAYDEKPATLPICYIFTVHLH